MLNAFNWNEQGRGINAALASGSDQHNAAVADQQRINGDLVARLQALGQQNAYRGLPAPAQVGSAQGAMGNLAHFLQLSGMDPSVMNARMQLAQQLEAQDTARQQQMYQQLAGAQDAAGQSRLAQAAFANAGAQRQIGDQWTQFVGQIGMQQAQADQEARQRLIEFALQAGITPEGMTR